MTNLSATMQALSKMRLYKCLISGKIDEWGSVIKNQAEAFKRMEEDNMRERKQLQQDYGQELESEAFNKLK